jgi:hypothetical protein
MIQERLWLMLGLMMILPIIIIMIVPEPYATVGAIGSNLVFLLYIRKFYKGIVGSILGNKTTLVCSVCNGKKFDKNGSCKKCGNKSRRLG